MHGSISRRLDQHPKGAASRMRQWGRAVAVRRGVVTLACIAASVLIVLSLDLPGARFAADRLKRIQELEAREAHLYGQLAERDAQRESQRRIYVDRIQKGEAQLREQGQEIMALRARHQRDAGAAGSSLTSWD